MKRRFLQVLLLCMASLCAADVSKNQHVNIRLLGSDPRARSLPLRRLPVESYFYRQAARGPSQRVTPRAWFDDIYPGIDLICRGDDFSLEYTFILSPGADPELIQFLLRGTETRNAGHAGNITYRLRRGEVIQSPPVIYVKRGNRQQQVAGSYAMSRTGTVGLRTDYDRTAGLNGTTFSVVPRGRQPGGPLHTFYLSKYETTNDQILRFLNDAERGHMTPRGQHMFFDGNGNVFFNPAMRRNRDEMFILQRSQLNYDPKLPAGERYQHRLAVDGSTPFADHPATGLSWFGGVKYANWLTIHSGRGLAQRCYSEGTNALDWAPVTATNWTKGTFGEEERALWLTYKGFRLPMLNCTVPEVTTNLYNEFYKAAAWDMTTNRAYAFGRDEADQTDANSKLTESLRPGYQTLPVGYFDGDNFLQDKRTHASRNLYGFQDLSGNVAEWMTDLAAPGRADSRIVAGGSWAAELDPLTRCRAVRPFITGAASGFRATTTYLPDEQMIVHVLFSFYMEPAEIASTEDEDVAPLSGLRTGRPPGEDEPDRFSLDPDSEDGPPGIVYQDPPTTDTPDDPGTGTPGGGDPLPPGPPPVVVITTNTLTVTSTNPNSNVPIDLTDSGGPIVVLTTYSADYLSTDTVQLVAPANAGINNFFRWTINGWPQPVGQQTINVLMNTDIIANAIYVSPVLAVSLGFSPTDLGVPLWTNIVVAPGETNWLVAIPTGGTGTYTYFYEYRFEHHVTFTNWVPATNAAWATSPTNQVWFYKDVRFRVTVDDGVLTALSNEALLQVVPNVPWPHPGTRVRP